MVEDLDQRGLLDETLIVLATEMGRTPEIDQNLGRNHHPKHSPVLPSGGILVGKVWLTDKGGHGDRQLATIPDFMPRLRMRSAYRQISFTRLTVGPFGLQPGQAIKALFSSEAV